MVIGDVKSVLLTLLLLVPGYIWLRAFMVFRKQPPVGGMSGFLNCFLISCVLAAIWFPVLGAKVVGAASHLDAATSLEVWMVLGLLFGWPAITGLALGWLFHRRRVREWLMRWNLYVVHPIDTAWDYAFGLHNKGAWVKVHMADGPPVYGYFGSHSLASTDPKERDIFLEEVRVEMKGKLVAPKHQTAVYIRPDAIKKVEFLSGRS